MSTTQSLNTRILSGLRTTIIFVVVIAAALWLGTKAGPWFRQAAPSLFTNGGVQTGDYSAIYAEAKNDVVLFSTSTCPYCKKMREMLDEMGVSYRDYVLDKSPEGEPLFAKIDGQGVPVLLVGDTQINGFEPNVI